MKFENWYRHHKSHPILIYILLLQDIQGVSKLDGKLQEWIPQIKWRQKGYDIMGPEMYSYRFVRACIYWVHADTSWFPE
jgi:hypothetical protein